MVSKVSKSLVCLELFLFCILQPVHLLLPADCSIPPDNVGANTYNTNNNIAIGEKAAVIAEDLEIKSASAA